MTTQFFSTRTYTIGLALLASACAAGPDAQPANFSQAPVPTAVYALDSRGSAASANGSIPEFLVWASDSRTSSPTPPMYFDRFRVEFDQPLDPSTISKGDLDVMVNTAVSNVAGTSFTYCTPAGTAADSLQLLDVDDTVTPNRPVPASICYEAGQKVGRDPGVVIVPGVGGLVNGSTAKPLTCQAFTPGASTEILAASHKYAIKISGNVKGQYSQKAVVSPSTGGWSSNTFTFTTADFGILAIGYQNGITGFWSWGEKMLQGFHYFSPAVAFANQVDCDQTSSTASQQPCRIPPDGSAMEIMFTQPIDGSSLDGNISISRKGGPALDYDIGYGAIRGSRSVFVALGYAFEPDTEYTVTLGKDVKSAAGTKLGADKVFNFKSATGKTLASSDTVLRRIISPENGQPGVDLEPGGVAMVFTYPVDISSAVATIKGPDGTNVAGLLTVATSTLFQEVDLEIPGTLLPGTKYSVKITGLKVKSEVGLPTLPTTKFPDVDTTFTTVRFNVAAISTNPLVGITATFTVPADPSTVNETSLQLSENGVQITGTTITPSADNSKFKIALPAGRKPKYGATYKVLAAGQGGTGTPIKSADGKYTLKAENCEIGDCSQGVSFTTGTFGGAIAVTDRSLGKFTVTFPAPGLDPTQISEFLANGGKMFAIYPQTLTIDPNNGLHLITTNTGSPIGVACTINTANTIITCAPPGATPLDPNKYYLATARFFLSKTADGGPAIPNTTTYEATTGLFSGSLARTFVSPCAP